VGNGARNQWEGTAHDTSEQASAKAAFRRRSDLDRRGAARVQRRRKRRRPLRQFPRPGNSDQDRANRVGVFDRGEQAQAPTASRTGEHVDVERAPHLSGPRPGCEPFEIFQGVAAVGDSPALRSRAAEPRRPALAVLSMRALDAIL
jgi:hypothetical protein